MTLPPEGGEGPEVGGGGQTGLNVGDETKARVWDEARHGVRRGRREKDVSGRLDLIQEAVSVR